MKRIIDKKGTGKTGRLMLLAKEYGGIIICSNPRALSEKAKAYGLTDIKFYSYHDFITRNIPHEEYSSAPIYIDEIEGFLRFINTNVWGYSLSLEDNY